jgi:hypothetical protein
MSVSIAPPKPRQGAEDRLRGLIAAVREALGEQMFAVTPSSVGSVAELLAAAPVGLCLELSEAWNACAANRPALDHEDQLVLELVLGLYNWGVTG